MAEQSCGGSIQACALRVAVLDIHGAHLVGASNMYVTDAIAKLAVVPNKTKGADIEVMNACGIPSLIYKARDLLKRLDLTLEVINLSADLENMLVGGEKYTSGTYSVGGSVPLVATVGAPFGVSLEVWSKHIVSGDLDPIWPYIHWIFPRTYWDLGNTDFADGPMTRNFLGYTTQNQNWHTGPGGDWTFASDASMAWAFTTTLPTPTCGATATTAS